MTTKHEAHESKKNHKENAKEKGAAAPVKEKFFDSLGQENPAMELEKELIQEKEKQREEAEKTATKEETK